MRIPRLHRLYFALHLRKKGGSSRLRSRGHIDRPEALVILTVKGDRAYHHLTRAVVGDQATGAVHADRDGFDLLPWGQARQFTCPFSFLVPRHGSDNVGHFSDVAAGYLPAMLLEVGDDSSGVTVGVFERHLLREERGCRKHDAGTTIERTKDRFALRTLIGAPRDAGRAVGRLIGFRLKSFESKLLAPDQDLRPIRVEAPQALAGSSSSGFVERGLEVQLALKDRGPRMKPHAQRHRSIRVVRNFSGRAFT